MFAVRASIVIDRTPSASFINQICNFGGTRIMSTSRTTFRMVFVSTLFCVKRDKDYKQ